MASEKMVVGALSNNGLKVVIQQSTLTLQIHLIKHIPCIIDV